MRFLRVLLTTWLSLFSVAAVEYPSHITLRGGVLHAPPFAFVETANGDDDVGNTTTANVTFSGFQIDLLERIKAFAAQDNVTLEVDLSPAPPQYGSAFDLVANDCVENSSRKKEECQQFDMIVGDYYASPDRAMRAALTPAWLRTTISTVKYTDKKPGSADYTTLAEAFKGNAKVCLLDGTFYQQVVKSKFPMVDFLMCPSQKECLEALKAEECALLAEDELTMRYRSAWDDTLEVTGEQISTQYMTWPLRDDLPAIVPRLIERWIFAAVTKGQVDDLYHNYFAKALCPLGTAGEKCELQCDPVHGTSDNQGRCICSSAKWTGDDCSIEVKEDMNMIPATLKLVAYGMLGINIAVICAGGVWLYKYRDTAQIRFSRPFFLLLVLLGCLISSFTIIPLAQEDESVDSCMVIPWLYSVGFSVTFGTLLSKILRVYLIFKQAAQGDTQRSTGSNYTPPRAKFGTFRDTLSVIGAVLLIDVTILSAWTAIDPLEWERTVIATDQFGEVLASEGFCTSDHWQIFFSAIATFHLLLLAIACWLCYVSREIPTKYSLGKYVSIAMISNFQILMVGVPVLVIVSGDTGASFFVRSTIIWMNDLCVVILIFGHLIFEVHFGAADKIRASTDSIKMQIAVSHYGSPGPTSPKTKIQINSSLISQDKQQVCSEESQPRQPRNMPFSVSSLSLGSSVLRNPAIPKPKPVTKHAKNVSWGSILYSENDEDEIPEIAESESQPTHGCQRRFSSHPVGIDAPARPPKRPSFTSEDLKDLDSELDEGGNKAEIAVPKQEDAIGAWLALNRGIRSPEATSGISASIPTSASTKHVRERRGSLEETQKAPQKPVRMPSGSEKILRNSLQPQRQQSLADVFDKESITSSSKTDSEDSPSDTLPAKMSSGAQLPDVCLIET